jgi:hypothetical protein
MVGFKRFYLESEGNGGLVTGVRKCNLKAKKVKFENRKYFNKGNKNDIMMKNSSSYWGKLKHL